MAAYVDLRTAMVLASDSESPLPQEDLDSLANRTSTLFQSLAPDLVPVLTAASQGQGLLQASLAGRDRCWVAVRGDGGAQEAVCCELGPAADLPLALAKSEAAAAALAEGGDGGEPGASA